MPYLLFELVVLYYFFEMSIHCKLQDQFSTRNLSANGRQIALDGEFDQAGDVVNVELSHQARAIGVYRFGTEFQPAPRFLWPGFPRTNSEKT